MPSPSLEDFAASLGLSVDIVTELRDNKTDNVASACQVAQEVLGPDAVKSAPSSIGPEAEKNWSTACWDTPACIIQPETTQDVATTLRILTQYQVPFSVRSGGHSPNPGFSSIGQAGVLIDLSRLDHVSVSFDGRVVSVGPGQRWGEVYEALNKFGISVIGGRIPSVGVGGLLLGGGYSHFSSTHGLAADNVKAYEVVLANGIIVTASSAENSDLYWALKGGGPNFGIVTRFDLYAVDIRDIWYEVLVIANSEAHAVLDAFAQWQETYATTDAFGTVGLSMGIQYITLGLIYSKPARTRPSAFSAFQDIQPMATAVPPTNGTVAELTSVLGSISLDSARHDYRAAAAKINGQLYKDMYDFWHERAAAVFRATGANQTFSLQPITAGLLEASKLRGGNPMGICSGQHVWWTTLVEWDDAAHDDVVREVSVATQRKWEELGKERLLYVKYHYMNDASRDQSPLSNYGPGNIAKLKAIAMRYDPDEVFQTLQQDGFLLRKIE